MRRCGAWNPERRGLLRWTAANVCRRGGLKIEDALRQRSGSPVLSTTAKMEAGAIGPR